MPVYSDVLHNQQTAIMACPHGVSALFDPEVRMGAEWAGPFGAAFRRGELRNITALRSATNRLTLSDHPADVYGALKIPNGYYRLTLPSGVDVNYRIYTVQVGSLQGRRIIKRSNPNSRFRDGFEGFAFLTYGGGSKVWRRFQDQTDEPFIRHLPGLLSGAWRIGFTNCDQAFSVSGATVTLMERNCLTCNAAVTATNGHWCENHRAVEEVCSGVDAGEHERLLARAEDDRRRMAIPRQPRRVVVEESTDTSISVQQRTEPLPMCQITGSVVQ